MFGLVRADQCLLEPGEVGTVRKHDKSSKPLHVETSDGSTWWYMREALQLVVATVSNEQSALSSLPAPLVTHDSVGKILSISSSSLTGTRRAVARVRYL